MRRSISMAIAGLTLVVATMEGPAFAGDKHESYSYGTSEDFSFVLVGAGKNSVSGSGDVADYAKARRLKDRYSDFLWVKVDGKEYVITDPDRYEKARVAMEPVMTLGKLQGRLGAQQGKLGARQGKLGAEQGRIGLRQGDLGQRLADINLAIQRRERRGTSTATLRRERAEVEAEMEELGEQMSKLGELQSALGREQEPLGREQSRLGQQQAEASRKMTEAMRRIIDDAIDDGAAIPVR